MPTGATTPLKNVSGSSGDGTSRCPTLTRALGYFPGRRLGWLEDLPRGVALDWARGRRDFAKTMGRTDRAALARCAHLDLDVLAVVAADDPYATPAAVNRTLKYLPAAHIQRLRLSPTELGVSHIGHLGLFHDRFRDTFWTTSAQWLANQGER